MDNPYAEHHIVTPDQLFTRFREVAPGIDAKELLEPFHPIGEVMLKGAVGVVKIDTGEKGNRVIVETTLDGLYPGSGGERYAGNASLHEEPAPSDNLDI